MYAIFLGILICLLPLSQTCFAQNNGSLYQVTVKDKETGEAILGAQVTIEVLNRRTRLYDTDSNGVAMLDLEIDEIPADKHCELTVEADRYKTHVRNINLDQRFFDVPLEPDPPPEYKNRIGLAMGYTHFKNIDQMTYSLAGAAYTRRIISYEFFDLTCYGYLDLTIMTSLNSEETYESGISGDETTFGRAVSYSINYVQSFQLDNNFSLLIEAGFQRLVVDLKINDGSDKLTKNSFLLGGGFEYNYQHFFVQTNLSGVIGEDKNLGHDINATIKTGINF